MTGSNEKYESIKSIFFYLFEIFISNFILWLSIEAIIIKLKLSNNWKCEVSLTIDLKTRLKGKK